MTNNFPQAGAQRAQQQYHARQAQPGQQVAVLEKGIQDIALRLDASREKIEAIAKNVEYARFREGVEAAIRSNPKLLENNLDSLSHAIVRAANFNLDPNPDLGLVYFVPRKGIVRAEPGYKGLRELVLRTGRYQDIYSALVYQNDKFHVEYAPEMLIKHSPVVFGGEDAKGPLLGAYTVGRYKDGGYIFKIIDMAYINKIEEEALKNDTRPDAAWRKWRDQQILKTSLRAFCNSVPKTPEITAAIQADYEQIPAADNGSQVIDQETGEVLVAGYPTESALTQDVVYDNPPVAHVEEPEIIHVRTEKVGQYDPVDMPPAPPLEAYATNMDGIPIPEKGDALYSPAPEPQKSAPKSFSPPKQPVQKTKAQGTSQNLEGLFKNG